MHILLIHQAFASLNEAGGTRHHELARALVERGHQVTVIASPVSYLTGISQAAPRWLERESGGPGITLLRVYTYPALHRGFFHRLAGFFSFMVSSFLAGLGVRNVDLVWGTSPPIFQAATAWALARLKRVPFLLEIRDLWPAFAIAMGVLRQPVLIHASLWLESFLYRHADRLVINSPGFQQHVLSRGARQVELVPNGADPAMFDPQASGAGFRASHGLDGLFIALYAGAHGPSNDLDVVLEAAQLSLPFTPIRFVLLGDGKEKPRLVAKARQMGLNNVIFIPPVPKNEMDEALAAANCCIAILKPIELYKTTYPNKVFDYMAAGRPVVLAIDGVIREVVESAGAGIPVPPGNPQALATAIQALSSDPERCQRLGLAGRQAIEQHFSRSELATRMALVMEGMKEAA